MFTEERGRAVQLRRARRDQDRSRGAGAGARRSAAWCSTATRTTSSPRPSRSRSARRTSCPGIDFTNDPLLAGRIHSYVDTQITRLGGPNFHEIPINAPVAQVHNNQRDGMHRQAIPRGRVAYEPNSLGGGCPFQAGARGFMSFPAAGRRATRCAASRRSSPTTTPRRRCSGTARPSREGAHRQRVPLRADQGADARDPRARGRDAAQRGRGARAGGRRRARHGSCPSRCRGRSTRRPGRRSTPRARCR